MNLDSRLADRTRSAKPGASSIIARKFPSMSLLFVLNSSTGQPNGSAVRSSCVGRQAQQRRSPVRTTVSNPLVGRSLQYA
jgi:hypothetical protein